MNRNYLEDEDFSAPQASAQMIKSICSSIEMLRENLLSPVSVPGNDIRIGNIEISDNGNLIFAIHITERGDAPYGVIVYKPQSEKYVLENILGALRYWGEQEGSFVDFNIYGGYSGKIKREYTTLPDRSNLGLGEMTIDNAHKRIAEQAEEFLRKQEESSAFMEFTGMDFVSEHAAKQILAALYEYEGLIQSALERAR
ncbi:MAG: hypothetical protein R3251_04480 [Candidatus Spechtbacterales bacterium]|nr:hypothetical protein [Candidatus Spechtbacterales bacterium]